MSADTLGGFAFLLTPESVRLRVWTVTIAPVHVARSWGLYRYTVRVPAYTDTEAACAAAVMSGIPREDWAAYTFTPTARDGAPGPWNWRSSTA